MARRDRAKVSRVTLMTPVAQCDFCGIRAVRWTYPADFVAWTVPEPNALDMPLVGESVGEWAACDPCPALIEAGNREGLLRRSVATCPPCSVLTQIEMQASIREIHERLFTYRREPAVRIGNWG